MSRVMYHGSSDEIAILRAGSYITPNIKTACEYGHHVYAVEVVPDEDVIEMVNGQRRFYGETRRGTCSRVARHYNLSWVEESRTYVDLPVQEIF